MAFTQTKAELIGARALQLRLQAVRALPRAIARDPRMPKTVVERVQDRFRTKRGPDGRRWKALNRNFPLFNRSNQNRSDILVDTGALRDSIGLTGRSGTATGLGFRIGITNRKQAGKAAVHQSGGVSPLTGGQIPARPFLGISKEDVTIVERLLRKIARERGL